MMRKYYLPQYYAPHPFTHLSDTPVSTSKQVVNTNKCLLHLEKHDDQLLITSVIDNLTKGRIGAGRAEHEPALWLAGGHRFYA